MPDTPLPDVSMSQIMRLVRREADDSYVSEATTTAISNFCMLWNIYEATFFHKDYSNKELLKILESDNPVIRINNIKEPLEYFRRRYMTGKYDLNERFRSLDPRGRTAAVQVDKIIAGLRDTTNKTNPEFAVLAIIFRLRNNLFHGEKAIESLNEQRENFVMANRVLVDLLENSMR